MENQELTGIPVLVNQHLPHDPAGKTGKTGRISLASTETDDFYVRFDDGVIGLYAADALLVLKPCGEIFQYLSDNRANLSAAKYKDLENIAFQEVYELTDLALATAALNSAHQAGTLISLEDHLALSRKQGRGI